MVMDCLCRALKPSCLYAREEQQVSDCECKDIEKRIGGKATACTAERPGGLGDGRAWRRTSCPVGLTAEGRLGSTAEAIFGDIGVN